MSITNLVRNLFGGRKRQDPNAYIISYPKSGRTWLRLLLGKALCDTYQVDASHMLDTLKVTSLAKITPTKFSHDGSGMREGSHYTQLAMSKTKYENRRVALLVRDPRDVIVSCYFQATKRINVYEGSVSQFIRDEHYGIQKCVEFYRIWGENQHVPDAFTLIRYEDMHADPHGVLQSVLEFIGADVSRQTVEAAVEFGRFENMKRMEARGDFKRQVLTPGNVKDSESFKVRRGKVGGYGDYLSNEDCGYLTEVIAQANSPVLNPYLNWQMRLAA